MAIILVDFDGTCVQHQYPQIGEDIEHGENVLRKLVEHNHQLILYTMRDKKELEDAIQWFKNKNINLYAINENPTQKDWTTSNKIHGDISIDDINLGIPTKYNEKLQRKYVDWYEIEKLLEKEGYFSIITKQIQEYFNKFLESTL